MGALKHPRLPSESLSLLPNPTVSAWRARSSNWWKGADCKWKCIWIMYIKHGVNHLLISSSRLCHVTQHCQDEPVCVTGPSRCGFLPNKHWRCFPFAGGAFLSMRMRDHASPDKCFTTVAIAAVTRRQVGENTRVSDSRMFADPARTVGPAEGIPERSRSQSIK